MSPSEVDSTKDLGKKSSQRRINKPLIEKRRRARINDSLAQLKSIVLEATDSKGPRPSKLEKADILEMTVEFIKKKTLPVINTVQYANDTKGTGNNHTEYSAGYSKCLSEISKFLEETRFVDDASKKLIEHISCKLKQSSGAANESVDAEVANGKIRIEPLRQRVYIDTSEQTQEAVDLSIRGEKNGKSDNLVTANQTLPSAKPMDTTNPHHVVGQQVPVGLVCGNHIMLLVQLPSSTTSQQQLLPQNVISLNHQVQTMPYTTSLGTASQNSGLSTLDTKTNSWHVELPTVVSSATQQNCSTTVPRSSEASESGIKTENTDAKSVKDDPVLDRNQHVINSNHWRPW